MKVDFNQKTLLEELRAVKGWDIPRITFYTWLRKGYIAPSAYINDGPRLLPVYYREDFGKIVSTLELLNHEGKIRLKVAT